MEKVTLLNDRSLADPFLNERVFNRLFFQFSLVIPQIRNPTKVSERCGPNRQECDFSSLD